MMKKIVTAIVILLCGTSILQGQVADSTAWQGESAANPSWQGRGSAWYSTGKAIMISGAATAAAGGAIMLATVAASRKSSVPEEGFHENMGGAIIYIFGLCGVLTGASFILAGIPVTIAGNSMMKCDVPWQDARYDTRGLGVILEGGYFRPDVIEARASVGYHFNSHIFLGGGVAPGMWLDASTRSGYTSRLSLPLYADFRWSMLNRLISPYLGLSAGAEMTEPSPYLSAEIGTRIRTNRHSTNSFWSAISGEVAGGYMRLGIKMGYSF